jgi:hypothetical protein
LELFIITEDGEEKTVSPWSLDTITSTLMLELNEPVLTRTFEPMTVELTGDDRSVSLLPDEVEGEVLDEIEASN